MMMCVICHSFGQTFVVIPQQHFERVLFITFLHKASLTLKNVINEHFTILVWHKKQRLVEMVAIGGRQKGKKNNDT